MSGNSNQIDTNMKDTRDIRDARVILLGILLSWAKKNNKPFGEAQAGTNIGKLIVD